MHDQYEVIRDNDYTEFITAIQGLIESGYEPIGGISIAYNSDESTMFYAQAMLKRENKDVK